MDISAIPNEYPIDLIGPDITPYAAGNTGIPYVWQFDSGQPGPHAMVTAVVHGNEPCGAVALDWLLQNGVRPVAGKMTLAFMNVAAYQAFDPDNPNASRWVEEDMNRVWAPEVLEGDRESIELRRARQVRPVLADVDYLFDIHSMTHTAPPVLLSGRHAKGRDLAGLIGTPDKVIADHGHASGKRLRDYGAFDDPSQKQSAVLIECGQHWEASAGPLAIYSTARILCGLGVCDPVLLEQLEGECTPQVQFEVTDVVTVATEAFRFAEPFIGGEVIAKAGTLLARDGDHEISTPYDDCMLVMPTKRLWPGLTAVRLARRISTAT